MELSEDIRAAIDKNLPAEVGKMLQDRLAKVDELQAAFDTSHERHLACIEERDDLKNKLAAHKDLDQRESLSTRRESEVTERERKMELNEYKVTAAQDAKRDIKELVATVFRNPKIVHSVESNGPVYVPPSGMDQYGSVQQQSTRTVTTTEQE